MRFIWKCEKGGYGGSNGLIIISLGVSGIKIPDFSGNDTVPAETSDRQGMIINSRLSMLSYRLQSDT